jgi:hypothetical protein
MSLINFYKILFHTDGDLVVVKGLQLSVTLRANLVVAMLPAGSPKLGKSRGYKPEKERCMRNGSSSTNSSYVRSSDISGNLKHRVSDAQDGSLSCSNRSDWDDLSSCCTVMWKANGKTITLLLFLVSLFPKAETNARCFLS